MPGSLDGFYLNPHRSQFDGSAKARENCVPVAGANGANASTGGRVHLSGGQVRALLPTSAETDPRTPGWSIPDLDHAMAKLSNVPFENRTGRGFDDLTDCLHDGLYVAAQGDSDQFSNNTCSGVYDGPHCIGIHPAKRLLNDRPQHWIDDGVCEFGRWEYTSTIRLYMTKLTSNVRFGVFTHPVPKISSTADGPFLPEYSVTVNVDGVSTWTKPGGLVVGRTAHVTYRCTREDRADGTKSETHWYHILRREDGKATGHRGEWLKGYYSGHTNPHLTIKGPF